MNPTQKRQAVFLLSPASLHGARAQGLLSGRSQSPLAPALHSPDGVLLGELFVYISSLYFRGKLAYGRHFAGKDGVFIILPGFGLVPPDWPMTEARARRSRRVPVDPREPSYREPLERDAGRLAEKLEEGQRAVLLGSLATGKYLDVLAPVLGSDLSIPKAFVGLGEMQRGSLLLKAVAADYELEYEAASSPGP